MHIPLRCFANRVIPKPAVTLLRVRVHSCKLPAEPLVVLAARMFEVEEFELDEAQAFAKPHTDDGGNPDFPGCPEFGKSIGFGLEHIQVGHGAGLDERLSRDLSGQVRA